MKPVTGFGTLLVVAGLLILVMPGLADNRPKKILDREPIETTWETREPFPFASIIGGLVLAGGMVLLVVGARQRPWGKL